MFDSASEDWESPETYRVVHADRPAPAAFKFTGVPRCRCSARWRLPADCRGRSYKTYRCEGFLPATHEADFRLGGPPVYATGLQELPLVLFAQGYQPGRLLANQEVRCYYRTPTRGRPPVSALWPWGSLVPPLGFVGLKFCSLYSPIKLIMLNRYNNGLSLSPRCGPWALLQGPPFAIGLCWRRERDSCHREGPPCRISRLFGLFYE